MRRKFPRLASRFGKLPTSCQVARSNRAAYSANNSIRDIITLMALKIHNFSTNNVSLLFYILLLLIILVSFYEISIYAFQFAFVTLKVLHFATV